MFAERSLGFTVSSAVYWASRMFRFYGLLGFKNFRFFMLRGLLGFKNVSFLWFIGLQEFFVWLSALWFVGLHKTLWKSKAISNGRSLLSLSFQN